MGQIRTLAVCNLTTTGLALLMTVWLVSTFGLAGAIFQVLSGALVALVVSGGFLYSMFRPSEHSPRLVGRDDARGAVVSALRVGLAQTMHWAVAAGNLFIFRSVIVASLGVHSNGLYQGTMSLSRQYTSALLSGIFVYLYPHLARTAGRSEVFARELTKAVGFGVALVVPISLMLSSTRDWIVQGIFTSAFAPMTHLMVYSLPGDAAEVLVGILRIALLACGPVRSYLVVGLMEQALYLGVFLGAVRLFGLTGAAGAYLVSGIAGSLMYGFALARRGEILLTPRFVWQVLLAGPVVGMVSMSALGVTSSRAFALALALLWIVAYRRELLSGLRN
jgi:O-antigen/teichoic acid export membrane protein